MKSIRCAVLLVFTAAGCACGAKRAPERVVEDASSDVRLGTPPDAATDLAVSRLDLLLLGARLPGGEPVDVEIRGNRIVGVRPAAPAGETLASAVTLDLRGRWLAPAFIDSHVHLTYWPVGDKLLRAGVIAAVDLAAPEATLVRQPGNSSLRVFASGPMITAVGGYPLDSWGRDGYGVECQTPADAIAAVDRLIDAGARLIKLPLGQGRPLPEAVARAAITRAHQRGVKVAVHALSDAATAQGALFGADVLAHTPVEPLKPATVEAWRGRAVITTLSAFGGSASTVANLRALRMANVTVVYGTDLGNTRDPRIDPQELVLLGRAGLDGAAIVEAATAAPARLWGMDDLGAVAPGKSASLLVLEADPTIDPSTLAKPAVVIVDGQVLK